MKRAGLPARGLAGGKNFVDVGDGVAAPALELKGADEGTEIADVALIFGAKAERAFPEGIAEAEGKREDLLERNGSGFLQTAAESGIGESFELVDAERKLAKHPGLMAEDFGPVAGENEEDKADEGGAAQHQPENFKSRIDCRLTKRGQRTLAGLYSQWGQLQEAARRRAGERLSGRAGERERESAWRPVRRIRKYKARLSPPGK